MLKPFDSVRARVERQYLDVAFEPSSGLSREELVGTLAKHRAANPDEPHIQTKAWLFDLLCRSARLAPEPGDPFVGKIEHFNLLHTLRNEWRQAEGGREFRDDPPIPAGAWSAQLDCASHICPDWPELLRLGATGLRARGKAGDSPLHQAVATVFDGMVALIGRFHALQPSPALAALMAGPPQTLHDALQLAYIYHDLMEMDGMEVRSMGRFDLLYNDFYLADLAAGRITRDKTKELLKYFWVKFFAKSMGKRFGKPFLFGPDANEFSRLALEAYHEMRIEDPKLHIRIAKRTSPAFVEQVARCIEDGCTSMVIGNDDAQVEMLCRQGKTREDANEYIFIGCYEPAIQGKELNCSGAATLNLAKAVEQTLGSDYPSFDAFLEGYLGTLETNIQLLADRVRRWERLWPQISPTPFLSGTMPACMERGLDISAAGAKYNTSGVCCIGLADAVDSLAAVRQLVYEERRCTLAELRGALADDWQGHEELRLTVRHRVPKWGNNDESVDRLAVAVTGFVGPRINREPNARNGVFQAALYGILPTVQSFGKNTGALPNGRRAGEHLTVNTGASVGMNRQGVTGLVNSVTKIDLTQFPNGTVLDIMLHPSALAGDQGWQTVAAVIRSHFAQGGLAIQFNIFDPAILREAKAFPEKHADLQVRVCGWNVLFSNLRPEEQDLFIAKAEAAL
jgi:formate C-acetyltransferase